MSHYICTEECLRVFENPMSCQMKSCSKYSHPLIKCECSDGEHQELEKNNPLLILIVGLPGTGKTTISKKISQAFKFTHIEQNEIRRGQGMKKMPQTQDATLREIDRLAANYLRNGDNIIVDSVHRYMFRRQQLYGVASGNGSKVLVIECVCSPEEAKKRIKERPNSDGLISDPNNPNIYDKLAQLWEDILQNDFKYPGSGHVSYITYNTEDNKIQLKLVQEGMKNFVLQIGNVLNPNLTKIKQ